MDPVLPSTLYGRSVHLLRADSLDFMKSKETWIKLKVRRNACIATPSHQYVSFYYEVMPSFPRWFFIYIYIYIFKGNPVTLFFCIFYSGACRDNSWLCIGSSAGLYVVDLATSELVTALYFKGRLLLMWL